LSFHRYIVHYIYLKVLCHSYILFRNSSSLFPIVNPLPIPPLRTGNSARFLNLDAEDELESADVVIVGSTPFVEKVFLAETLDQWANQAFDYRKPAEAVRVSCRQACLYRDFWGGRGQNRPWVHSVDWYPSLCGEAGTTLPKEEGLT
jgi:hypothetical protein